MENETIEIVKELPPAKVMLVALDLGKWDCERSLAELSALAEANHMETAATLVQKKQAPEAGTVLGEGKLAEGRLVCANLGIDAAIFDGELTGSQIRNLTDRLGVEVLDRTMLILEIFQSRAVTGEGKLQTELAMLRYRLYQCGQKQPAQRAVRQLSGDGSQYAVCHAGPHCPPPYPAQRAGCGDRGYGWLCEPPAAPSGGGF